VNLVLPLTTLLVQLGRNILKKNAHMGLVGDAEDEFEEEEEEGGSDGMRDD